MGIKEVCQHATYTVKSGNKKVRQSERLYNEALAEMEEKKKELDMHLEELKKWKMFMAIYLMKYKTN